MTRPATTPPPPLAALPILVVEDSNLVRERVMSLILDEGPPDTRVFGAATAAEARDHLTEHRPEAVVLDLQLPDGSGLDLLAQIKREAPQTVVYIFTSHVSVEFRHRCAALGANGFFSKAQGIEDLVAALRRLRP